VRAGLKFKSNIFHSTEKENGFGMSFSITYCWFVGYTSNKGKVKGYPCTGTEALYRPYGPQGGVEV